MPSKPKMWSDFEYGRLEKVIQRLQTYQKRLKDISNGATISDENKVLLRSSIDKIIAAIASSEDK